MKKINLLIAAIFIALLTQAQSVADFANLTLAPDTFWDGSNLSGGFSSGAAFFNNVNDTAYGGYWAGFAYSNMTGGPQDTSDTPLTNTIQYSSVTGAGYNNTGNYAVAYDDGYGNVRVKLLGTAAGGIVDGFYVTNSLYTYLSMQYGDQFDSAFSYTNGDWFELNATGWLGGVPVADTVHFYLADFRTPNSPGIVTDWQWMNLQALGAVDSVIFMMASSQTGPYGINTPTYFCMDNFTTADNTFAAFSGSVTIDYFQDTIIDVVAGDTSALTVTITSGPFLPGASALVLGDSIWYIPTNGVVATDQVFYQVCNSTGSCSTGQITYNITGFTGIHEIVSAENKIYPNPFSNSFYVVHSSDVKEIRMYDLQGRLVKDITCNLSESNTEINAVDLAAGTYFVKIISDGGSAVAKIIRQ